MRLCHFRAQNGPFVLTKITNHFGTNHYYYFIKKKPLQRSRVMRMHHFWAQIVHLPQTNICLKIIKTILIYLLAPFIVQNFKKILPKDPELWGCAIFGPKMVHFLKWEFFSGNLLISLVSFIHAYLHAKNQSQLLIY